MNEQQKRLSHFRKSFNRRLVATQKAQEIHKEIKELILPKALAAIADKQEARALMYELVLKMDEADKIMEVAMAHLGEVDTEGQIDRLANDATLESGNEFMATNDPATILWTLENYLLSILEDQLVKLQDKRFEEIENTMEKARARRYHNKLQDDK